MVLGAVPMHGADLRGGSVPTSELAAEIPMPLQEAAAIKRETVEVARRIAEAYPEDAAARALLGSAHYNIGQSEMAIRELKSCLELNPDRVEAYEVLARIAYEKGNLDECVEWCEQALKRKAVQVEVQQQLGRALMDLGRPGDAVTQLRVATRSPEATSETFYLLGQACLMAKQYPQAKLALGKAVEVYPEHTQGHFGLYTVSVRLGEAEEAARHMARFRELEATDLNAAAAQRGQEKQGAGLVSVRRTVAKTFFGAAQVYGAHGAIGLCRDMLRKASLYDPENGMYRGAIEGLYQKAQGVEDGLRFFEELVKDQPEACLNHLFVGRFHAKLGRVVEAESAFKRAKELGPMRPEPVRSLADLYVRNKMKADEAVGLARKAAELEPSGAHFHLLALAQAQTQDRAGALKSIRRALELSPDNAKYRQLLEQLEVR